MSEPNPYQSPGESPFESQSTDQWDSNFEDASQSLAQTKPWVLFLSILGFIATALMFVIFPLTMLWSGNGMPPQAAFAMIIPIIMVIGMSVLCYLIPSLLLWRYGRRIGRFVESRNPSDFADAIEAQKSFWRYVGILALVVTVLYAFLIAGFAFLPIFMRGM